MQAPDLDAIYGADVRRANRRRLLVFLGVLLAALAIGLGWNFSRPPEYRATARLQITPPVYTVDDPRAAAGGEQAFLTEVQTLSSRPLIDRVAARLRAGGYDLAPLGLDPVLALQSSMTVNAVTGTQVVEMEAFGRNPELPAALLVGITEVYAEHLATTFRGASDEAVARAEEESVRLEAAVAQKRRAIEEFRVRNRIVSPEREENSVLAEMQGLAAAQKEANKRLLDAEGRVEALRAAAAAGKGALRARDNPGLATLEARAAQLREELRELSRRYTPAYLDANPDARAIRARLAETEEQLRAVREVGQKLALEEAEQDLAEARETARRLQQQIEANRRQTGEFAARFSQYRALEDELGQLQKAYQDSLQRQARLDASERSRAPSLQILEQAVIPKERWRPAYWRDAAIVFAAALLLALGAMWLVELFNRTAPKPSVLITQPVFGGALPGVGRLSELEAAPAARLSHEERPRLAGPALPRELTIQDVASLLRAADADTRNAAVLLLSGLTPEEALALRRSDVAADAVLVAGTPPRQVAIAPGTLKLATAQDVDRDAPLLRGLSGPMTAQELPALLLVAAHDAGLADAREVTPAAIRHTYIAFLVRQGARFADITRWVGTLSADELASYSALAPAGQRADAESVRTVYPALQEAAAV